MKKKIFGGLAILAIAAVAVFNVNFNSKSSKLSDVSLANVEALAADESGKVIAYCCGNTGTCAKSDDGSIVIHGIASFSPCP